MTKGPGPSASHSSKALDANNLDRNNRRMDDVLFLGPDSRRDHEEDT